MFGFVGNFVNMVFNFDDIVCIFVWIEFFKIFFVGLIVKVFLVFLYLIFFGFVGNFV